MVSIIAVATDTNKDKTKNQDFYHKDKIDKLSLNIVIVADGMGSCKKHAQISSKTVVSSIISQINKLENITQIDLRSFFHNAREELIKLSEDTYKNNNELHEETEKNYHLYGTTLIVLIETKEKIKIAYVGDGSVWHIRGNFNQSPPWNAINLLNPHNIKIISGKDKGRTELYQKITEKRNIDCTPTIIEIEKDNIQGDIFMICSDGVYSEDSRWRGFFEKWKLLRYEKRIQVFFNYLNEFFSEKEENVNINIFENRLQNVLRKYLENQELDDDATIGVLITETTINNYLKIKESK